MPLFCSNQWSGMLAERKSNRKQKNSQRHFSFLRCLFYCRPFLHALFVFLAASASAQEVCLTAQQQLKQVQHWAQVKTIVDGDTLHLKDGRKIRLIGINTPELGHRGGASEPFGLQAWQAVQKLLATNKKVGLYYDRERKDRYKRTLAYVVLPDGTSIEENLLRQGLAVSIVVMPNDRNLACYRTLETQARKAGKGLWQLPEMQWFQAAELSAKAEGYRFVSGRVLAYNESRKYLYLKLSNNLSVQIARKDQKQFKHLKSLVGKQIRVRGWIHRYKGKQNLRLKVRDNLELVE